eukprot:Pgem_evm2s13305
MKLQTDHDDPEKLKNDLFAGCKVPLWNIVSAEFVEKMTDTTKKIHIFFSAFKPQCVLPMTKISTILSRWISIKRHSFILHPLNYDALTETKDLYIQTWRKGKDK